MKARKMSEHIREHPKPAMLSPLRVADYVLRLEARLGRRVEHATVLPDGGIQVKMAAGGHSTNPADLVDMTE